MSERMYHERFTPKQIALWMTVKRAILAQPEAYAQSEILLRDERPDCGSPVCMLGWVEWCAFGQQEKEANVRDAAGISEADYDCIFSATTTRWPGQFRFDIWETPKHERAQKAAAYIAHILTTGSVQ